MDDLTPEEKAHLRQHADAKFAELNASIGHADGSVEIKVEFPTAAEFAMAARHVLWHLDGDREVGEEPGNFIRLLIEAMCHADRMNLSRLAAGFPAYATAVAAYKHGNEIVPGSGAGGVEALRTMARMI